MSVRRTLLFSAIIVLVTTFSTVTYADRLYQVQQGQTLTHIAHLHGTTVTMLSRLNRLSEESTLQIGQRLWVPGAPNGSISRGTVATKRKAKKLSAKVVGQFYRVHTHERARIALLDDKGRVRMAARRQLSRLMRPRTSKRTHLPHPRLVQLLAHVSKHFEGKPIHIISGYRRPGGYTHRTSRHTLGRALDFRILGVSNLKLRDYCRRFEDVGVGYYPRSSFIHLDVRDKNAFWVDVSRAGEAPSYRQYETWLAERKPTPTKKTVEEDVLNTTTEAVNEEQAAEVDQEQDFEDNDPTRAPAAEPVEPSQERQREQQQDIDSTEDKLLVQGPRRRRS